MSEKKLKKAFLAALHNGDTATARAMIAHGLTPNIRLEGHDLSCLHLVVSRDNLTAARFLIRHGADVAKYEEDIGVSLLVSVWAHRDVPATAQPSAATAMTTLLLDAGAHPDGLACQEEYPLLSALETRNYAMMACLLKAGANPVRAANGRSALHAAAGNGDRCAISLMQAHGASLHALDAKGRSLAERAALAGASDDFIAWLEEQARPADKPRILRLGA